jgi:hypothetical protein
MRISLPRLAAIGVATVVPIVALTASAALAAKPMAPASKMMEFHSGATIKPLAPASGAIITGNAVTAKYGVTGFTLDAGLAGTMSVAKTGHLHVMLDRALVDMYGTPGATISLQNVKPGKHMISVVAAANDHSDDMKTMVASTFVYAPAKLLPEITAASFTGKPAVEIVSPKPGATVTGSFDFVVKTANFNLSHDLFGKPNVKGYGHWHANVDSTTEGMMGMATMLGMSGSNTFHVNLKGIKPGKHRFFAILEDNQHAPTPSTSAAVTVTVK